MMDDNNKLMLANTDFEMVDNGWYHGILTNNDNFKMVSLQTIGKNLNQQRPASTTINRNGLCKSKQP